MILHADTTHQRTVENFLPGRDEAFIYNDTDFNVMMGLFMRDYSGKVVGYDPLDPGYFDINFKYLELKAERGSGESSYEETVVKTHPCLEEDK